MRIPIKATAREPINRPDTYQRLPLSTQTFTCDQQPVHTFAPEADIRSANVITFLSARSDTKERAGTAPA